MAAPARMTFGFPRMHREEQERRDFLPPLVGLLTRLDCEVVVETGIGSGMGYTDEDYTGRSPLVRVADEDTCYRQDVVVVLRAPGDRFEKIRRGATLISMLHFPTRPARVELLSELGIEAVSLDTIVGDEGRRLVVNARAVAWNGVEAAFQVLERTWPALLQPTRPPVRVTVMGAGKIGRHAVEAATKYGDRDKSQAYAERGLPGVEVVTIGRNLTSDESYLRARLRVTDVLVDATQRDDPRRPLVPNAWIGLMPPHAVICDLVVDPYLLEVDLPTVRGIEGIPQGDLDKFTFGPNDPEWDQIPSVIPTKERRSVVSCYSWPGVHPEPCMELYGTQLAPLLETLVRRGGIQAVRPDGDFHERALYRGSLRAWLRSLEEPVGP